MFKKLVLGYGKRKTLQIGFKYGCHAHFVIRILIEPKDSQGVDRGVRVAQGNRLNGLDW